MARWPNRLEGADRAAARTVLADRYHAGDSIRGLATTTGRSYGQIRALLLEEGVRLRPRGRRRIGAN